MNWFKSFWKKRTAPTTQTPPTPTLREIFGGSAPSQAPGEHQALPNQQLGNFTPRAQEILVIARREADRLHHNFVGTEHVLLGLVALGKGVAVNVLQKEGVDLLTVRAEVEKRVGTGPDQRIIGNIPYTPRTKKVLDLATKEPGRFYFDQAVSPINFK